QQPIKSNTIIKMRKSIILVTLSLVLFSCGKSDEPTGSDLAKLKAERAKLQEQITELDEAIAKIDTVKPDALVSVAAVKDTVFTHYIDIQGNVTTNEDILIQPEISGTLVALNVKAGQNVSKGQVL